METQRSIFQIVSHSELFGICDDDVSFIKSYVTKLEIMGKLGIDPGDYTTIFMKRLDGVRVIKAKHANSLQTKVARKDKKFKRKK